MPAAIAALAAFTVIASPVVWILIRPAEQTPVLSSGFSIEVSPSQPLNVSTYDRDVALHLRAIDQLEGRQLDGISY
jgi:hypothetical protein